MTLQTNTNERHYVYTDCTYLYDHDLKRVRDVSMYKMATAGVSSGTILAVHLQKCSHLLNEIRVMQNNRVSLVSYHC
jgi:hypothetical protein